MSTSQESESPKKRSRQKRSPVPAGGDRAMLVEKAIQSIEGKLGSQDVKATFSDFIRLLQLQKELQIDQPREIKVSWIESSETVFIGPRRGSRDFPGPSVRVKVRRYVKK
jgi:hypothetical protein